MLKLSKMITHPDLANLLESTLIPQDLSQEQILNHVSFMHTSMFSPSIVKLPCLTSYDVIS